MTEPNEDEVRRRAWSEQQVVDEDGCCAREPDHPGPCNWICSDCGGSGACPVCVEECICDDVIECEVCEGADICLMCDGSGTVEV